MAKKDKYYDNSIPFSKAPSKNSLIFLVNDSSLNAERKKFLKEKVLPRGPCVAFEYYNYITPEEVVKYSKKFGCYFIDDFLDKKTGHTSINKVFEFVKRCIN